MKRKSFLFSIASLSSLFILAFGLIASIAYSDTPTKTKKQMEGNQGTFCCCPGSSTCGSSDCSTSVCEPTANPK